MENSSPETGKPEQVGCVCDYSRSCLIDRMENSSPETGKPEQVGCACDYNRSCLIDRMENSSPETGKPKEGGCVCEYNGSCVIEKRDTSPGRPGKKKLKALLNGHLKIKMTDGRVLIGIFLCTDRDANVILGSCSEYLREEDCCTEEPRILGLVMVPGRHIVSIHKDQG